MLYSNYFDKDTALFYNPVCIRPIVYTQLIESLQLFQQQQFYEYTYINRRVLKFAQAFNKINLQSQNDGS